MMVSLWKKNKNGAEGVMYSEGVFCSCCKVNLRSGPYDKNARAKRKA